MKKILLLICFLGFAVLGFCQKYAIIDTKYILDKSEGITVIFADPKLDKSDDVLRELGIRQ